MRETAASTTCTSTPSATSSASTTAATAAPSGLLTGSHYDTVRNGGKYDGRLGILVPMACVRELQRAGRRLPFGFEVVGFAEEEGQRYKATFLGSGALTGHFDPAWLDQNDADGVTMRDAMRTPACRPGRHRRAEARPVALPRLRRGAHRAGPGAQRARPAAGHRHVDQRQRALLWRGHRHGQPRRHHADGPPPRRRRGGGRAGAVRRAARRARAAPGRHRRHAGGAQRLDQRHARPLQVQPGPARHHRRGARRLAPTCWPSCSASASGAACASRSRRPCAPPPRPARPAWQQRWERPCEALGLPLYRMPSGAGHDAMKLHEVMPQAMLFVRGENSGISHNPLESITTDDTELAVRAFQHLLDQPGDGTAMTHDRPTTQLDAWIDAHFDEEVRFLQELVQRAHRHAAGQQRAARRAHRRAAARLRLRGREAPGAGATRCRRTACSRSPT